ncbi:MAG: hypothetical protein SFT68_00645 [Rickettsiaceae bacterium]|nr:hypothetical protein [Rickettsiaceae bacterium]
MGIVYIGYNFLASHQKDNIVQNTMNSLTNSLSNHANNCMPRIRSSNEIINSIKNAASSGGGNLLNNLSDQISNCLPNLSDLANYISSMTQSSGNIATNSINTPPTISDVAKQSNHSNGSLMNLQNAEQMIQQNIGSGIGNIESK